MDIVFLSKLLEKITTRLSVLRDFCSKNRDILKTQKHLDEGSSERAYWHAGYASALADIVRLVESTSGPIN